MSAIPPPPVGPYEESAAERASAVAALREELTLSHALQAGRARRSRRSSLAALAAFGGATILVALSGARPSTRLKNRLWYRLLRKPSFTPPKPVFAFVWTPIYALSAYSGWRVWRASPSKARSAALALWGAQLTFNGAWSWLFFVLHRPRLALADIVGNFASLGAYTVAASRVDRPAAAMVAPYLGWLTVAGALNRGIVRKAQLV